MANVSLDGYLSQKRKKDEEKEEIYRRLDKTLEDTRKELDAYYRKGIDNVGSTRTKSFEEIEKDLENAVMEIKRDADEGVYSKSSKKTSLPGMTPQWQDPRGYEKSFRELEESDRMWKKEYLNPAPKSDTATQSWMKNDVVEDDFIEKTYQKYLGEDYREETGNITDFSRKTLSGKYGSYDPDGGYFSDKAATEHGKKVLLHDIPNLPNELGLIPEILGIEVNLYDLIWSGISNLDKLQMGPVGYLGSVAADYVSGIDSPGIGNVELFAQESEKKRRMYLQKQEIADELLNSSYYRYLVDKSFISSDQYLNDLKEERDRLRRLPYSDKNKEMVDKIDTILYMNQNHDLFEKQFLEWVDSVYEERY